MVRMGDCGSPDGGSIPPSGPFIIFYKSSLWKTFIYFRISLRIMVTDAIANVLLAFIAISATLAAIAGLVALQGFFHNKLKELFNDVNYFIFFFLVFGYFLYALGELSFYLSKVAFQDTSLIGIQDVYWSAGGVLILVSFISLAKLLFREQQGSGKLTTLLITGVMIVGFVLAAVFGLIGSQSQYFFGYFYPIISSLIVTASLSVVLFYNQLGGFKEVLLLFFLASSGILLGDIFFHYSTTWGVYGVIGLAADISYLAGYSLSFAAFVTMRMKMKTLAFARK